tara:strand:+ start:263 stop:2086 length:1824 start_codon:yes stop_codon:yes gene_type:complete
MAKEELILDVKTNIGKTTKETKDWAKELKEVNEQLVIQDKVINDLEKELIQLKAKQDAIPKGAWVKGMDKLNDKIKRTSTELKLEKNALNDLKNEQKQAASEAKKYNQAQKDQNNAAKESIGSFTLMGVSLNGVRAAMVKVAATSKAMFASIKAGLISTGIGAFVVAIGSLVSYFTQTKRGSDLLKQALAGLGAIVSVVTDKFSLLGETMVNAFKEPKKAAKELIDFLIDNVMNRLSGFVNGFAAAGKVIEAALDLDWERAKQGAFEYGQALIQVTTGFDTEQQENFINGIKKTTKELKEETKAMAALEKARQNLRDEENEFIVTKANTRREIEKARLGAEDETKSAEQRLASLEKALELEGKTTNKELELAKQRVTVQEQEMALSENMAEDEAELARLRADVIDRETASVRMQKRVIMEVNTLRNEINAQAEAERKKIEDEIAKDNEDAAKAAKLIAEKTAAAKIKTLEMTRDVAMKIAGEGSAVGKAVAVASAIMNTKDAVTAALGATPYGPWNIAQAVATGAFGMMQVKDILSTPTPGNASGGGSISAGSMATATAQPPAPQMMGGSFELGSGVKPDPVQAFVVSDDITNNQDKLAAIRRRATI